MKKIAYGIDAPGVIRNPFMHMKEYEMNFMQAGLITELLGASYFTRVSSIRDF